MASKYNAAAVVSLIAVGIAAVGTALLLFGVSPGYVSPREPGVDRIENHVLYFGPAVLISWVTFAWARPKTRAVLFSVLIGTVFYVFGLLAIR